MLPKSQSEFVALSRDRDGAIGTAAAFFGFFVMVSTKNT
jgi:hypothetical protein